MPADLGYNICPLGRVNGSAVAPASPQPASSAISSCRREDRLPIHDEFNAAKPTWPAAASRNARGGCLVVRAKTLQEREKELKALLATPEGQGELEALAGHYAAASGRPRPTGRSVITYILVHERQSGLVRD